MLVRTNIEIESDLLEEARIVSSLKTKKEIVFRALEEFIARRKRAKLLEIRHQGLWQGDLEEMRGKHLDSH